MSALYDKLGKLYHGDKQAPLYDRTAINYAAWVKDAIAGNTSRVGLEDRVQKLRDYLATKSESDNSGSVVLAREALDDYITFQKKGDGAQ